MAFPRFAVGLLALSVVFAPARATAQGAELFNFPETHDTTFGPVNPLGAFYWTFDGQGVKGRRVAQNIDRLDAFGFNLLLEPSCITAGTAVTLDVFVNDVSVGSVPMPPEVFPCNSQAAPIQGQFDLSASPIAGLGTGREFEVRFQIHGTATPPPGFPYALFYKVDTANSSIALAGHLAGDGGGGSGGGGDTGGGGSGGGGGGSTDTASILGRIDQAESNISSAVGADGNNTRTALQSVKDALGVVEGNVNASIAGAVLKVNGATAIGLENLANQLGVSTQDLTFAVKGNGDAIGAVQRSIEQKLLPEILASNQNALLTQQSVQELGNNFFEKTLGMALGAGTRVLGFMAGGSILGVADFVQKSIQSVVTGALRPDRIVNKAIAEFNRGLKRLKKIFRFSATLSASQVKLLDGMQLLPGGDEQAAGPDTEEEDVFGAYVWFERAYQTLVKGQANNAPVK